jgi:hypothetical protein
MRSTISKVVRMSVAAALSIATIPPALAQDTCRQGFVWREAFPGDQVCVTPRTRDQAAQDNSQAAARRVASTPSSAPPPPASYKTSEWSSCAGRGR